MLCDECKKNQATYHSIKKINGVSTERHLCHTCHLKQQGTMGVKFSGIDDFFSGFNALLEPRRTVLRCTKCGTTSEEFLNSGYVGCSECYNELASVVMPVVQKVQSSVRHTGSSPTFKDGEKNIAREYELLRLELEKAIAVEDYEQASVIRDKMRQLKGV